MSARAERGTLFQILADPAVRVAIGAVFVMMLGYGIVAPILPLYARSFGVGYGAAGLLISMFAVARLIFDVVSGPVVDRYGERTVATSGLAVLLVSSLLTGLAPTFALAVLFRAVGGAGSSAMFTAMYSYLLKIVPKQQMGRTLGLFYGALNMGIIAGGPLGGFIAHQLGLNAPLFFYSGLMVPAGFLVWRYLRVPAGNDGEADRDEEPAPLGQRLRALLRTRGYVTALVVNLAYAWMVAGVYDTLVPLFGRDGLGLSTLGIGVVLAVALAAELVVMYPAGAVADRVGRRPVLIPGLAAMVIMTVVLGQAGSGVAYAAILGVFGLATGAAGVAPAAMLSDVVPEGSSGTAIGVFRFCGDLGFIIGPLVAGSVAGAWGFHASFAVAAVPTIVALLFAIGTPETYRHAVGSRRRPGPRTPPTG
ncbi:MAG: MFS transporter [Actinomycetota bacterium]|nr:MFS transporter [Actinomycetota bacterium]